ncbi:MAG: glycosyltransferase family 39 protein [Planctomycetaceae bacterium]|nr:glycosyltransferase family 39 protein [Planctomycetaceae bacterium]
MSTTLWSRILMILALGSAVVFCWPVCVSDIPLQLDEHVSWWIVDDASPGTLTERSLNVAATPPLGSWPQQWSVALLGKSELALRLPSLIAFVLAVWVTLRCGVALQLSGGTGPVVGGLAALLLVWHPVVLDEVRIGRCYGQTLLLSAICFRLLIGWRNYPQSWKRAVGFALASAALAWTHYVAVLFPVCIAVSLVAANLRERRGTTGFQPELWIVGLVVALATLLCWPLLSVVFRLHVVGDLMNLQSDSSLIPALIGKFNWVYIAGCLLGSAVAGRIMGGEPVRTRSRAVAGPDKFLLASTLLPMGLFCLLSLTAVSSVANSPRYAVAYLVPQVLCVALLTVRFARESAPGALIGVVAGVATMWCVLARSPLEPLRLSQSPAVEWKKIGAIIEQEGEEGEPLLVQSGLVESALVPMMYHDPVFLDYAACRAGRFYISTPHPRFALPYLWDVKTGVTEYFLERFHEFAQRPNSRLWIAAAMDTDLNEHSMMTLQRILTMNGWECVGRTEFDNSVLEQYRYRGTPADGIDQR